MSTKHFTLLFLFIYLSTMKAMEKEIDSSPFKKPRKETSESALNKAPSLYNVALQVFFKQDSKNLSLQLEQHAVPEELAQSLLDQALLEKLQKRAFINLVKNLPLYDYSDLAVNIAYSYESSYLSIQDKIHILFLLREIKKPKKKTKKVLNGLRRAFYKTLEEPQNSYNYATIDPTLTLFQYSLAEVKMPSKTIKLFIKYGLPLDTSELVGDFIKTFKHIDNKKLQARAIKKLSLLINTSVPLYNEYFNR